MKKDKKLLSQLFDGEIYPAESIGDSNKSEFKELNSSLASEKENLLKKLADDDKELFDRIEALYTEYIGQYGFDSFVCGFQLGAGLTAEAFECKI